MPAESGARDSVIGDALGLACGILDWDPENFWRATPFELAAAFETYCRFHGLKKDAGFSGKDAAELRSLLNEQVIKEHVLR